MENNFDKKRNESGQALLFVVVAITISLAIGVSVSTRALNSAKRVARTDTSQRVNAAAEGGIEGVLGKTDLMIEKLLVTSQVDCKGIDSSWNIVSGDLKKCEIKFTPSDGDEITARALIWAGTFVTNGNSPTLGDYYWFNLDPGYVKEVYLGGYGQNQVKICWTGVETAIYYLSYNSSGDIKKGGLVSDGNLETAINTQGFDTANAYSVGSDIYDGCSNVNLVSTPYGLRIRTLYGSAKLFVFGVNSDLPTQGYEIYSKGELLSGGEIKETKTIVAQRSYPYASSIMDQGFYSPSGNF